MPSDDDDVLEALLVEYDRALAHTARLTDDLHDDELRWRPSEESSAIGWHLAHQAAVAHFMLRNLTAARPRLDPVLEALADSATPEPERGDLPDRETILRLRSSVARHVRDGIDRIAAGDVGAPNQLRLVATTVLTAIVDHEYQHDVWIAEVRTGPLGRAAVDVPASRRIVTVDGYPIVDRSMSARP